MCLLLHYPIWSNYSCYTVLPYITLTFITGMSLQTKRNYFIYSSSSARTEIQVLRYWQEGHSNYSWILILHIIFVSHPISRQGISGRSENFKCHFQLLKWDTATARVLDSHPALCNWVQHQNHTYQLPQRNPSPAPQGSFVKGFAEPDFPCISLICISGA